MNLENLRLYCLSLPHATEVLQWEDFLLMKVGGKMFAILALEPDNASVCNLRVTPEQYFELVEREGIEPASHNMWKFNWVAVERYDVLLDAEWHELIRGSYDIIYATLSKKVRVELEGALRKPAPKTRKTAKKRVAPSKSRPKQ